MKLLEILIVREYVYFLFARQPRRKPSCASHAESPQGLVQKGFIHVV